MKKFLVILFLIFCSFASTIYSQFFPEDIYGKAHFLVIIIEIILIISSVILLFIYRRYVKKGGLKTLLILSTGIICLIINLNILPTKYGPYKFISDINIILKNYEDIKPNNFTNSSKTEDAIINNVVLHKFDLSHNVYFVEYLKVNNFSSFPESLDEYPIWINDNETFFEKSSLSADLDKHVFTFIDTHYTDSIKFLIGTDGLNRVEDFYTGGGTNEYNIVESGVIDQKDIRIIVSICNAELVIDNSYGILMKWILKILY